MLGSLKLNANNSADNQPLTTIFEKQLCHQGLKYAIMKIKQHQFLELKKIARPSRDLLVSYKSRVVRNWTNHRPPYNGLSRACEN